MDRSNRAEAPLHIYVLAVVIAMSGSLAALRAPIDIFPSINIPVVSVVWSYNGMLPKDMSDRVIYYYYERQLTSQVSNIEHIESQSLNGYGTVKIYFQKGVNIGSALAQVSSAAQSVLKLLPAGITPPYVLSYNASSVPILQLALSSKKLPEDKLFDLGQNFIRPQLATVKGAAQACECTDRSVPLGKYCLSRPLVFSFDWRCHGLCGSQKFTSILVANVKRRCRHARTEELQ